MGQFSLPVLRVEKSASRRAHSDPGARRVSDRARRRLVGSLRRLANSKPPRDAVGRRWQVVRHDRVAAVRTDLLEIAALLECASEPDPGCVAALRRLLTDGCESPIYNPDVHPSELLATIYYVRRRLLAGVSLVTIAERS